jgi:hypothetical protein
MARSVRAVLLAAGVPVAPFLSVHP